MNSRNIALGVVALGLIAGGIWWATHPAPTPEKPAAPAAPAAPVASAPKVEGPVVSRKQAVATPMAAPVAAAGKRPTTVAAAPVAGVDPELNATLTTLINDLEAQDANGFVDDFIVPGMMDMAKAEIAKQAPPDATPEMRAQIDQIMAQQMPKMIDQMKQQMTQQIASDPKAQQGFQKLGAALKQAQNTPPQMNETGDKATYTLDSTGDKEMLPSITFTRKDGKWIVDMASMMEASRRQP